MSSGWELRPSTRRATLPRDWPRRRRACLRRAGYLCEIGGPRCIGSATEADHAGDREDHDNLRAACSVCHGERSSAQGGVASGKSKRDRLALRNRPTEPHPGEFT